MLAAADPRRGASRLALFGLIAAAHLAALAAFASVDRMREIWREAEALQVSVLPPEPPRVMTVQQPVRPPPMVRVPLPEIRPPDIPRVEETITVRQEERAVPSPVFAAVPEPNPPPAAPQPAVVAPRADLAYLQNPPPAYPAISRRAGEQGRVLLRVRVDAEGRAEHLEVEQTSGFPRLDEAAIAAVKRWRFAPARQGERAIAGVALVPVRFSLHG
jgi:protein TonB